MIRIPAILLTLLLLAVPVAAKDLDSPYWATVVRVVDGDTIHVLKDSGERVKVRLYGIDAPEDPQPWGLEAERFLRRLILNQPVKVSPRDVDKYGRLVAEVILQEGLSLTMLLIEEGHAWWYEKYNPGCGSCKQAQKMARLRRKGLWSAMKNGGKRPVPPWEWRRGVRI